MYINAFTQHFPVNLTETLLIMGTKDMQEIRLCAGRNAAVIKSGRLMDTGVYISKEALDKIIASMCRGSMYAMQTSLVQGFLTLSGGHRVGVCGRCVTENGRVTHLTDISSICIRVAKEVKGAANEVMEYLECNGRLYNTLIISPPGCGKTTLLRDIARRIGENHKVCIADERSEIAACKKGIPSYDVGKYTCVMDCVPKAEGILMMLRTMAPEVIITDETGSRSEGDAIRSLVNCGAKIITTAHGYSDGGSEKYADKDIFERIIILSGRNGPGTVEKIITDGRVIRRA
ncbi:MAG: stage III sporulation protein AA [Clostridia bacterium]|nr:stage III sporulation protein AA [Clostridia bacterium]